MRVEPRNALAWKALGVSAGKTGDTVEAEAEAAFREALRKPDAVDEARLRMGVFLFRAGRIEEADRVRLEAVKERAN